MDIRCIMRAWQDLKCCAYLCQEWILILSTLYNRFLKFTSQEFNLNSPQNSYLELRHRHKKWTFIREKPCLCFQHSALRKSKWRASVRSYSREVTLNVSGAFCGLCRPANISTRMKVCWKQKPLSLFIGEISESFIRFSRATNSLRTTTRNSSSCGSKRIMSKQKSSGAALLGLLGSTASEESFHYPGPFGTARRQVTALRKRAEVCCGNGTLITRTLPRGRRGNWQRQLG